MIKLTRPLVILDVESTGVDPATDAIFSFAALSYPVDGTAPVTLARLMRPWKPIPEEVEKLTGTTNALLEHAWPFKDYAREIWSFLQNSDLAGFNLSNFDIPILWEELYRCGITWDLSGVKVIDCGTLFKIREPRDLGAALKFYCNKEHDGAHNALSDVVATASVLDGQRTRYQLEDAGVEELSIASRYENDMRIDLAGKLVRDADGDPVYNIGKAKGVKVKNDPGFGYWMLGKDFSQQTKQVLRAILDEAETKQPRIF